MPSPFSPDILELHDVDYGRLPPALSALYEEHLYAAGIRQQIAQLRDVRLQMSERMEEQDFAGDFDPRAPIRNRIEDLEAALLARESKYEGMVAALTSKDKDLYGALEESACEWAREDAADRRTRWYEDGCPTD